MIENSGTISAAIALLSADGSPPGQVANHLRNTGLIEGVILLGFGNDTYRIDNAATWFTHPSSGEAGLAQDQIDLAAASQPGRVSPVAGGDAAMPGTIDPATLAFHAPVFDDHLRAEFCG